MSLLFKRHYTSRLPICCWACSTNVRCDTQIITLSGTTVTSKKARMSFLVRDTAVRASFLIPRLG